VHKIFRRGLPAAAGSQKSWGASSSPQAKAWRAVNLVAGHWLNGAPGETRTPDPLLRRQTLYPTELRALSP
jgi:hypothetical protein